MAAGGAATRGDSAVTMIFPIFYVTC
jgi:hypothetical protein